MPTTGRRWTSVEVTGPLTGKIHLKNPSPAVWLIALADGSGVIISKKAFEELGDKFKTTPIGSGPYILKEWVPRDHFTLVANPDYIGEKPAFAEIVGKPIADDKTAQLALQAGEIDFARIDPAVAKDIESAPGIKVQKLSAIDYVWIGPNIEKKPFDDVRVRQAIRKAHRRAGDHRCRLQRRGRAGLCAAKRRASSATGRTRRNTSATSRAPRSCSRRRGRAAASPTKLTVLNKAVAQATAAVVQANLAEIGIDVQIDALDEGAYWAYGENDASKDLELVLVEYRGKFDPGLPDAVVHRPTRSAPGTGSAGTARSSTSCTSRAASRPIAKKREQIYIDAQKLMDEFRRLLVDHAQRLHLRLQGHAGRRASCPMATNGSTPRSSRLERLPATGETASARRRAGRLPSVRARHGRAMSGSVERRQPRRATSSSRLATRRCWCWSAASRCSAR